MRGWQCVDTSEPNWSKENKRVETLPQLQLAGNNENRQGYFRKVYENLLQRMHIIMGYGVL